MDGGLLSLRWNDHGQTFFKMLSGVRKREAYCDVTLACDGRFYPVHKLVLSTCSDFFDQMFEKTACKHPVIVVANVAYKDLEALLNYMYLGEVNVLQTELTGLMKAAEALRIKGLAEPSKGPSSRDFRENKRSSSRDGDLTDSKRKRTEETQNISRQNQLPASESDRMVNSRETQKSKVTNNDSRAPVVKAQGPSSCGSNSSNSTDHPGASSSTEPLGNSTKQDLGASSQSDAENDPTDKALRPEVKMEEVLVKEEPSGWFPETEEGLESLQFSEADTSLGYTHQPTTFRGGCLPWDLAAAATQAHVLDSQLSQGIPGPSRMQGTEEDPSQARPMNEKFVITDSLEAASSHKVTSQTSFIDIGTLDLSLPKRFSKYLIKKILTTRFVPHRHWKPPQRQFGKYRRRVPEKLFNNQQYPTLRYSVVQDGLYCAPCVAFQNTDAILVGKPLQDWSNAIRHTLYHLQSEGHLFAFHVAAKFLSNYETERSGSDTESTEFSPHVTEQEPSGNDIKEIPPSP
ncbi:longitudinals lacking protein, isoforms H/M/V isoform X1 [Procambarus clarkii]|uniref:longitudinals lacking protein, isoforms H/M/V isoform X1 n=1 Tax=Procambarus clarkii TaxID=6728 RepID=UPI001E674974|nr:longitudinals lacking protein, isoforms H/M/V-like isoform X1 [Procambarus clarkii]